MKTLLNILDGIAADNCEETYQAFYPACPAGDFAADKTVEKIEQLFQGSDDPVVKSYCFLLLGAVVDSGALPKEACQPIVRFLAGELNSLTDFSLFDDQGRYIHYLSHMTYLAESLRSYAEIDEIYDELLTAYLRNDLQVCGNAGMKMP